MIAFADRRQAPMNPKLETDLEAFLRVHRVELGNQYDFEKLWDEFKRRDIKAVEAVNDLKLAEGQPDETHKQIIGAAIIAQLRGAGFCDGQDFTIFYGGRKDPTIHVHNTNRMDELESFLPLKEGFECIIWQRGNSLVALIDYNRYLWFYEHWRNN